MKHNFPPTNQNFQYLQTNRSDRLGSLWSSFNLDFQSKMGTMRLAQKLVTNTTSSDDADLGLPVAFEFWSGLWWAICGTRIFKNSSSELTANFAEDATPTVSVGSSTSQFDVTNPTGTTFRYTWDGTGTDPGISATTFPIGATVQVSASTNFAAGNQGTFTITGSGANYFEVTNASGAIESNKTIGSGNINITGGTFGQDYSSLTSDMTVFNDRLWVSSDLYLRSRTANSPSDPWKTRATFASSGVPHPLIYFKKFDRLYYVSQSSFVGSIDTSDVLATTDYTINPGTSIGYISCMVATTSFIWIGTFRDNSGVASPASGLKGSILQWDGFSEQVISEFPVETSGIWAICAINDVPYALDSEGRILKYTGYSFQEIARLPIDRTLLTNSSSVSVAKFVHFNGMTATKNNTILISVNNLNNDWQTDIIENLPSGVWELDLATSNFIHKYSPTLKTRVSSTITDYGQNRISAPGAIKINTLQSASANGRSTLIAGFNYFTDATTVKSGIFVDAPSKPSADTEGQKRGYFVTTWFESNEITDNWTRIWATYRRFLDSSDKIILKYRLNEEDPIYATITWTSTTTFTTTDDVSAYEGYEAEILQGTGSGACADISDISLSAGTYTVTLDTAIIGVTGTAKARFQKWIKLGEITGQILSYGSFPIAQASTRIQIKCVMEFTGDDELHRLILNSEPNLKAIS